MIYRRYGKTGLHVSILTFGSMRIPFKEESCTAQERARNEANAVQTLKKAARAGINHIDSARGYGNSEKLIGLGLKEVGRDSFYLSTKITATASYDQARRWIDEALEKFGTEYIDVMNIHGINTEEKLAKALSRNGIARAIQKAIDTGRVGHLGFSTHGPTGLICKTISTGLFSAVSLLYSYTYQVNAPAVKLAGDHDMGVCILSPSEKGGLLFNPPDRLKKVCAPFDPLTLLHRWSLNSAGVTTLAIGAANPGQFDAHMPAAEGPGKLSAKESAALQNLHQQEQNALGNTRCTLCYECMPCPENVAIPEILRLRNLCKAFDMDEFGKMRYNLLPNGGDWFPGKQADACTRCNKCLPRCPEKLAIPDLLKETHEMLSGEKKNRLWSV
ncbi:MAG: aldo/keto reductase [Chitinivibrionales bacterium]|nr:aldo/keto reductase [Chitinivibrionales bacterium]